ncbi:MAG: hypothetical protein ACYDDV_06105 [Methanoregula sp.]
MTEIESEKGDVAEPGLNASGALYSNRIIPRAAEPVTSGAAAGETTIIFHETGGDEPAFGPPEYSRCNAIICEASRILETWGYMAVTIRKSRIPFDLVGMRPDETLVIEVVRSRRPVPDAPALCEIFRKEVSYLQSMKISFQHRKMIWVYSPQCRWRFYDVFPGGVWLAKDLMESDRK